MSSIALIEAPFLSISALLAQAAANAAAVQVLGFEGVGNECVLIRLGGELEQLRVALDTATELAPRLGVPELITHLIAHPANEFSPMIHFANAINPLYGGRDQLLPTDFPPPTTTTMSSSAQAIGILETQGLTAILEATDAMLKAANVSLVGKEKIGAAYVTVIIRGDVAAVTAAIEAGSQAVGAFGKLIAAHVIPRPHDELLALLPKI